MTTPNAPMPPVLAAAPFAAPVTQVVWVQRALITANAYNPNHVAPQELALLKASILDDGWTQPLVLAHVMAADGTLDDFRLVDGFHRYLVSADADIAARTSGYLPCVYLAGIFPEQDPRLLASTVRHNRARGTHSVLRMAGIVTSLINDHGMQPQAVSTLLQMDNDEVYRLYDTRTMPETVGVDAFSFGWQPTAEPQAATEQAAEFIVEGQRFQVRGDALQVQVALETALRGATDRLTAVTAQRVQKTAPTFAAWTAEMAAARRARQAIRKELQRHCEKHKLASEYLVGGASTTPGKPHRRTTRQSSQLAAKPA